MVQMIIPTQEIEPSARLQIAIHIQADILSAQAARKQANLWLLENVGNLLRAGEAELILDEALFWRMSVFLTSPKFGNRGKIGQLCLNAATGDIQQAEQLSQELRQNAQTIAR